MATESYEDIIKGGKLPDKQVVIRTSAGSAPAVKTTAVSSVFQQGTGKPVPPIRRAACRALDEIETVSMPAPEPAAATPSQWAQLYATLEELSKTLMGKQLTKQEREGLYRWALKNKKPLVTRKVNNGPTPYCAWVPPPKNPA